MEKKEIFEKLKQGIHDTNPEIVKEASEEAIKNNRALEAITVLTGAMKEFGEKFGKQEVFLADLMMAADTMKAGLQILLSKIPSDKLQHVGKVLIGTVQGDIHDIGKTIVSTMLIASGFEVNDIGIDCSLKKFAETAEAAKPDVIAVSALMTTSIPMMKELIEYFTAIGIRSRYKIIVGGAPVTEDYAKNIGADGYGKDAIEAVEVMRNLVSPK